MWRPRVTASRPSMCYKEWRPRVTALHVHRCVTRSGDRVSPLFTSNESRFMPPIWTRGVSCLPRQYRLLPQCPRAESNPFQRLSTRLRSIRPSLDCWPDSNRYKLRCHIVYHSTTMSSIISITGAVPAPGQFPLLWLTVSPGNINKQLSIGFNISCG